MAEIDIPDVPSLTDLRVEVRGEMRADHRWFSAYFDRSWRGVVFAEEPVLALAFGTDRRGTYWVKSYPAWGNAIGVELVHGPYAGGHALYTRLYSRVHPPVRAARDLQEVAARAQGRLPSDGEIQVPDGGSHHLQLAGSGVESPDTWPPSRLEGRAGRRLGLLDLPGVEPMRLDLFVLPRRILDVGRSKIWRPKPRYRDDVPEPLLHVLRYGRAGGWPPRAAPPQ